MGRSYSGGRRQPKSEQTKENERIGRLHEVQVILAFSGRHADVPDWFVRARPGTLQQDQQEKADVIVETTGVGEIRVQVKSSSFGVLKFAEKNPGLVQKVALVIVRDHDSPAEIRAKTIRDLERVRGHLLA